MFKLSEIVSIPQSIFAEPRFMATQMCEVTTYKGRRVPGKISTTYCGTASGGNPTLNLKLRLQKEPCGTISCKHLIM
jgi:hypothetical protein